MKDAVQTRTGARIAVAIKNESDFRNYKVSCDKARTCLGFRPIYDVTSTVESLFDHRDAYGDFSDDAFYNIRVFKTIHKQVRGE